MTQNCDMRAIFLALHAEQRCGYARGLPLTTDAVRGDTNLLRNVHPMEPVDDGSKRWVEVLRKFAKSIVSHAGPHVPETQLRLCLAEDDPKEWTNTECWA